MILKNVINICKFYFAIFFKLIWKIVITIQEVTGWILYRFFDRLSLHNSLNRNHHFAPFNRLNYIRLLLQIIIQRRRNNTCHFACVRSILFSVVNVINRRGEKKRFLRIFTIRTRFRYTLKGRNGWCGIDVCGILFCIAFNSPPFVF